MFIEYPKSLYRGLEDERVANDATEEKALRADGYAMLSEEVTEAPKKRGRPAKVTDATS
jgi:hypothetical protein